jgi:hypothetical protein
MRRGVKNGHIDLSLVGAEHSQGKPEPRLQNALVYLFQGIIAVSRITGRV